MVCVVINLEVLRELCDGLVIEVRNFSKWGRLFFFGFGCIDFGLFILFSYYLIRGFIKMNLC